MSADLVGLLSTKQVAFVCGSGGVGKTTTTAALGVAVATRTPARVLVITVDPAKRLADALGLAAIGNAETKVDLSDLDDVEGELWVAMLDTKQSWDELIERHAPNSETRDAILANGVYQSISGRFVQSHDYIAAERLYEIHRSGRYDLIVVDTPPSRHALDLLDAPGRMAEFFSSRLLKWLTLPARHRLLSAAYRPFTQIADRILGSQFLGELGEFFSLLQTMDRGFSERATAVEQLFTDRRTTFVVVSTLEPVPAREAQSFIDAVNDRHVHLGGLVLNKVLPEELTAATTTAAVAAMRSKGASLLAGLDPDGTQPALTTVWLTLADNATNLQGAARSEAELRRGLSAAVDSVVSIPHLDSDIVDLVGLEHLATYFG